MAPKISRRVLASLSAKPEKKAKLETSEDFLEQGTIDEESGDRWTGSDLAKALRFYQKAYDNYLLALTKPVTDAHLHLDIYYNIARLLFHVYSQYFETDGVDVSELVNVDEVTLSPQSVIQELPAIVKYHERALQLAIDSKISPLVDLLYNTAIVYTQVVEESNAEGMQQLELATKIQDIFQNILDSQITQLHKFVQDLDLIDINDVAANEQTLLNENAIGEEVVQPPDVFETVQSCFKYGHSLLQSLDNPQGLNSIKDFLSPFLLKCSSVGEDLISSFAEDHNTKAEYLSSISNQQILEFNLFKLLVEGLLSNDLDEILHIWDQAPEVPEKYLYIADNIQEFLDRNDLTVLNCNESQNTQLIEGLWKSLSTKTNTLKKSQEMILLKRQELLKAGGDGVGTLLAQLSKIMIERGDIDIQRSQLLHEQGIKNKSILIKNCRVFLVNAVNTSNLTGGLREKVTEKMCRAHRKAEASTRLQILDRQIHETDDNKWLNDVPKEYFLTINQ